ncbi:MAG: hypothetical protein AUG51_13095 [Acidobacteria bacterium 13_1_20CM_3_53_8]|nr:MAG: hypothetical protein AUG51_13095 [Acidobacteria bacterium 13_1_20CM_3_53_8]
MSLLSQTLKRLYVHADTNAPVASTKSFATLSAIIALIFLVALTVRIFSWQDTRLDVEKVQTWVSEDYRQAARLISRDGFGSFFAKGSPLSDPNRLGHPPGYSFLLAAIYRFFGEGDATIQFVQVVCDSVAAVFIFLIVGELLPTGIAVTAGILVALAPQLSYNSVLLLPDSLAVLPIILAVYLLVRAIKRPRLVTLIIAGALVGVSCWLRANALFFAPMLAAVALILFERGMRLKSSAAILCGALLVIAPLTIRNAVVLGYFVPVSLGAGQTLIEGIADYDHEGRFGMPATDMGVMRMEAELNNRPDYYSTLFNPDGVRRERMRLARGFSVIKSHPVWFLSIMLRRGSSMFRLERSRRISPEAPVTHSPFVASGATPAWSASAAELMTNGVMIAQGVEASTADDGQALRVVSDGSSAGTLFTSPPVAVERNSDYVLRIPVKVEQGGAILSVTDATQKRLLGATPVLHTEQDAALTEQPVTTAEIAFVSYNTNEVRVALVRGDAKPPQVAAELGRVELFHLGSASLLWTRYPRMLVHAAQQLYLTAVMLPLELIGLLLLIRGRLFRAVIIVLAVPFYYFCFQSPLHTEYRYVLAVNYFLFMLVAVTLYCSAVMLWSGLRKKSFEVKYEERNN